MDVQHNDCYEAVAEADDRLSVVRSSAARVMAWYEKNPAAVAPPLVVRADMLAVAAGFQELDTWLSEGGTMPLEWRKHRPKVKRPELRPGEADLSRGVVRRFMEEVSPLSVPQEEALARTLLSKLLAESAEPREGFLMSWRIEIVNNGYYRVETNDEGVVVTLFYASGPGAR